MLKVFSWLGYISGAICLVALFVEGDMFFLVPAIGAIASGAVFAALDIVIVELKGIRSAISGGSEKSVIDAGNLAVSPNLEQSPHEPPKEPRSIKEIAADIERLKSRAKTLA